MERMRDVMRNQLRNSLRELTPQHRLATAWPVACGRTMAERGVVKEFVDGVLRIEVSDAAWLAQMRAMRKILEEDVGRVAGVRLSAIHFELKRGR